MNIIEKIQESFNQFLVSRLNLTPAQLANCSIALNVEEDKQQFGDLSANAAMVLAKELKQNPRAIAQMIVDGFQHESLHKIEIAGPGFLNMFLTPAALQQLAHELITHKEQFFKQNPGTPILNYNIEFVSANPTGPLHLGHGRGGIIGDVLGNILAFLGQSATKEFYINDAGAQIQKLGSSFKIRCLQAVGIDAVLPEDAYHGEYLIELARQIIKEKGEAIVEESEEVLGEYAKQAMLAQQKKTLAEYGIEFDVWFSEKTLHQSGAIDAAIAILQEKGHLYELDGALWFKGTEFGDDKDRVLRKQTGELTYVAADIAYMLNKASRGFNRLIMVLGHDHHAYVRRLYGIQQALGLDTVQITFVLYQLVKMKANGEMVRMSKRAGNIVTLDDVIETVGTDVARFFYLNRKADAQLEFDLDLALSATEENPVHYLQYAYVRINSILAKAAQESDLSDICDADIAHIGSEESLLIKKIASLKELLVSMSHNQHSHLLTYYALELAKLFHNYYSKNRVIDGENIAKSRARLAMMSLLRDTLGTVFDLLEISKPARM